MKPLLLSILLSVLMLAGCASTGAKFDLSKVDTIKPGVTTSSDLEKMFGLPWSKKMQTDKTTKCVWQYTRAQLGGIAEQQVLTVFLKSDGTVQDYSLKKIP
jgi:hypothetical protein